METVYLSIIELMLLKFMNGLLKFESETFLALYFIHITEHLNLINQETILRIDNTIDIL